MSDQAYQTLMRRIEILRWLKNSTARKSIEDIRLHLCELSWLDPEKEQAGTRMVQREMSFLTQEFDEYNEFDICWSHASDDGRKMVYWVDPTSRLDVSFGHKSTELMLAFSLADKHLAQVLPRSSYDSIKRYFDNVQASLAEEGSAQTGVKRLLDRVAIDQRGQRLANPASLDLTILDIVYSAIRQNRQLKIVYRGRESTVHPAAVVIKTPKIYMVAKYSTDDFYRNLLVHRISQAEVEFFDADIPADFDLNAYLEDGGLDVPIDGDETVYDVVLRVESLPEASNLIDDLIESPIHKTQQLEKKDDHSWNLRLSSQRTYQLVEWIVARGKYVTVDTPLALKQDVKKHLQDALAALDASDGAA